MPDPRHKSIDPRQSTLSHTISTLIRIKSAFCLRRIERNDNNNNNNNLYTVQGAHITKMILSARGALKIENKLLMF